MIRNNGALNDTDLEYVYKNTAAFWSKIQNKKILITGGTGFFGKWLLFTFLYNNEKLKSTGSITILTRSTNAFLLDFPYLKDVARIDFIEGDILDCDLPDEGFDFIIHAATDADAKLNSENPLLMLDTIITGTKRILEFAKTQPLISFLLTSSGAIYGEQPSDVSNLKEDKGFLININKADSAYAEGKRISELYCSIYYKQFAVPVKIARCFAFVGPYLPLDKHFAIGNFILDGLQNKDIIIKGDGSPYRSYMYAADLAVWLWTILLKAENNTVYNVGSDEAINIKELAETVAMRFNNKIKVKILGIPSGLPPLRYIPDISKAKKVFNILNQTNLFESIDKTIQFHNANLLYK